MILDSLIALLGSLAAALAAAVAAALAPVVNLFIIMVEGFAMLFADNFKLGRWQPRRKATAGQLSTGFGLLGVIALVVAALFAWPLITQRTLTLVAEDGHTLPFAEVQIVTTSGTERARTDNAGRVSIPRFTTESVTIHDPRYVAETWSGDAITSPLVVQRTLLGAGLDKLANKLLQPAKEE